MRMWTDGASRGNPGKAAAGIVVGDVRKGIYLGDGYTNNEAEYLALIEALGEARQQKVDELEIFSDSLLMVNQINGVWAVHSGLVVYLKSAISLLNHHFKKWSLKHIPREFNREADRLANEALDGEADYVERWPGSK